MSYESTLQYVRELSERATLRPAPKHLRLTKPGELPFNAARPAIVAYEDRVPIQIGSWSTPHQEPRAPRPKREVVSAPALERQWMREAAERAGYSNV